MEDKINSIFLKLRDTLVNNINKFEDVVSLNVGKTFYNEKYFTEDIRKSYEHRLLFEKLQSINKPVLYWFTFHNEQCSKIRSTYENYKNNKPIRNSASYKSNFNSNSNTLYVGKVKTGFWGRLITHLGYSQNPKTAGLQLFHWYDCESFSNLTLNYIVFEKEMENLITVLEMELSRELKPILGKY